MEPIGTAYHRTRGHHQPETGIHSPLRQVPGWRQCRLGCPCRHLASLRPGYLSPLRSPRFPGEDLERRMARSPSFVATDALTSIPVPLLAKGKDRKPPAVAAAIGRSRRNRYRVADDSSTDDGLGVGRGLDESGDDF